MGSARARATDVSDCFAVSTVLRAYILPMCIFNPEVCTLKVLETLAPFCDGKSQMYPYRLEPMGPAAKEAGLQFRKERKSKKPLAAGDTRKSIPRHENVDEKNYSKLVREVSAPQGERVQRRK